MRYVYTSHLVWSLSLSIPLHICFLSLPLRLPVMRCFRKPGADALPTYARIFRASLLVLVSYNFYYSRRLPPLLICGTPLSSTQSPVDYTWSSSLLKF